MKDIPDYERELPLCRICGRPIGAGYAHGAWCVQYAADNPFDVARRFDERAEVDTRHRKESDQ